MNKERVYWINVNGWAIRGPVYSLLEGIFLFIRVLRNNNHTGPTITLYQGWDNGIKYSNKEVVFRYKDHSLFIQDELLVTYVD